MLSPSGVRRQRPQNFRADIAHKMYPWFQKQPPVVAGYKGAIRTGKGRLDFECQQHVWMSIPGCPAHLGVFRVGLFLCVRLQPLPTQNA